MITTMDDLLTHYAGKYYIERGLASAEIRLNEITHDLLMTIISKSRVFKIDKDSGILVYRFGSENSGFLYMLHGVQNNFSNFKIK